MEFSHLFKQAKNADEIYEILLSIGKTLPPFPQDQKLEENLVQGCQSIMYLSYEQKEGKLYFYCDSDALISKGLAAFCISLVNGLSAEEILKHPFSQIKELNLPLLLSPSRSNGLKSLIQKIKAFSLIAYSKKSL
jgi:cysteine desulfuration protein SufE